MMGADVQDEQDVEGAETAVMQKDRVHRTRSVLGVGSESGKRVLGGGVDGGGAGVCCGGLS